MSSFYIAKSSKASFYVRCNDGVKLVNGWKFDIDDYDKAVRPFSVYYEGGSETVTCPLTGMAIVRYPRKCMKHCLNSFLTSKHIDAYVEHVLMGYTFNREVFIYRDLVLKAGGKVENI